MPQPLFHILPAAAWRAACESGEYAPDSLADEGFVHCSYAGQVGAVADALYRDRPGLVVVELDPDRIGAPVLVEDSYGSGEAFPHVYGAIRTAAAVAVRPLSAGAGGADPPR
jgi:uncharacterized protein (DUF952 family)